MELKRIYLYLLLLLLSSSCVFKRDQQEFLIAFSQCTQDPWRAVMEKEMYRELSFHQNLRFIMRSSFGNKSQKQVEQIRELMTYKPDLLIVSPNEATPLTPIVDEIYDSGIPVILIDRKTTSNKYTAYVGADNFEIGHTAGEYIANTFRQQGEVIEIHFALTISAAQERLEGFKMALNKYPDLNVVASVDGEDVGQLGPRLSMAIKEHPNARIIFGFTDYLAETAHYICREMGIADQFFFVGIDGIPGTGRGIEAVEDGVLDASMLYPTGGREAIRLALSILQGLPHDKMNALQTTVIDPGNASIIQAQMKTIDDLQNNIDRQISWIDDLTDIRQHQTNFIIILIVTLFLALTSGAFLWRSLRVKQRINKLLESKNQEILEQQQRIVQMSKEIKDATQAKVNFFTNISHEIRTPLTLILGFIEDLLPGRQINQDIRRSLTKIQENTVRLLRLVNELLDFQKVENEKLQIRVSEHDIVELLRNVMSSYEKIARKRDIKFELHTRQEHLKIWFDVNMLDKVIFNLLSNAFKFTADGGRICLSLVTDNFHRRVAVTVEDDGIGMNKEEIQHIFEPFYQGERPLHSGTGLGLALSKTIVELHHGQISVSSTPGKGSRFTLLLPLGREPYQGNEFSTEKEYEYFSPETIHNSLHLEEDLGMPINPSPQDYDHKLLIIEDNLDIRDFLRTSLGSDYAILLAADGSIGLEQAFDHIPDLIICDVMLPEKDGLTLTQTLKSDLRTSHIPIILLTARTTLEQQIEGTRAGADAYIEKPFHIQFLKEKIKNLLLNRALLKESFENISANLIKDSNSDLNTIDQKFLNQFAQYIDQHYARNDLDVAEICKEMGLSRSQLYRKLKALIGQGITDYIQQVRLKKSEKLLRETDLPISEVAFNIGYTSPDYFATVFKSKYNITPTAFRNSTY